MSVEIVLAFALAMLLLSLTPGPGFLAVVARALSGGFLSGLAVIAGLILGDLIYLLLAIVGLTALEALMGGLFLAVKILAALYLVWLGVKTWRAAPLAFGSIAARAGRLLASPRLLRHLNKAAGGLLIGAGITVAARS